MRPRDNKHGLSLVETLVGLIIGGVLLALIAGPFLRTITASEEERVQTELDQIYKVIRQEVLQNPDACREVFKDRAAASSYALPSEGAPDAIVIRGYKRSTNSLTGPIVEKNMNLRSAKITGVQLRRLLTTTPGFGAFELEITARMNGGGKVVSRTLTATLQENGGVLAGCEFAPSTQSEDMNTCNGSPNRIWNPTAQKCETLWYSATVHAAHDGTATCPVVGAASPTLDKCECANAVMAPVGLDPVVSTAAVPVEIFRVTDTLPHVANFAPSRNYAGSPQAIVVVTTADIASGTSCECLWPVRTTAIPQKIYPTTWAAVPRPSPECDAAPNPISCFGHVLARCRYNKQQLFGWPK